MSNVNGTWVRLFSLTILLLCFIQTSESILYIWNGSCQYWAPYGSNSCWEPKGIPLEYDTIQVPAGKNLTLYCPGTFSGTSNSFHSTVYSYGPTCVFNIGSIIVNPNATFQVSSYLAANIKFSSFIEQGANATLWGSLAAIDGPGELHVAGNLSVSGGNIQGNGSLIIEETGLLTFDNYEYENLDCYLLRTNIIVNGKLKFNQPTMIGFWWEPYTIPYNFSIIGSVTFNTFYVFNLESPGVNFNILEGGEINSNSEFSITDISFSSLVNNGNVTSFFPVNEIENYATINFYSYPLFSKCSSALNYGAINQLVCEDVLNYGNLTYSNTYYNLTNYGNIEGGYSDSMLFNYGNVDNLYSAYIVYNFGNISISSVYKLINEGVIEYATNADLIYNYGLLKTETNNFCNMGTTYNHDIMYITQDSSVVYVNDDHGIIYTDVANFEFQPAYWFWKKGYPQSVYPEVPAYGPEFNRPVLKDASYYWNMNFTATTLSGTGSFQLNLPVSIHDNLLVDAALNIEIGAANFTDPYKDQFSFSVAGNITITDAGLISAEANFLSDTYLNYFHVFGVTEMKFVFTNLSIVIHPLGVVDVPIFLQVMEADSALISINNTIEVFGSLSIEGILNSDVNIILYGDGDITLQKNSVLNLADGVVIENCGGKIINNGGTLNGEVVPCSLPDYYQFSEPFDALYSPFIDAVEFVRSRRDEILTRFAKYDLKYHHKY